MIGRTVFVVALTAVVILAAPVPGSDQFENKTTLLFTYHTNDSTENGGMYKNASYQFLFDTQIERTTKAETSTNKLHSNHEMSAEGLLFNVSPSEEYDSIPEDGGYSEDRHHLGSDEILNNEFNVSSSEEYDFIPEEDEYSEERHYVGSDELLSNVSSSEYDFIPEEEDYSEGGDYLRSDEILNIEISLFQRNILPHVIPAYNITNSPAPAETIKNNFSLNTSIKSFQLTVGNHSISDENIIEDGNIDGRYHKRDIFPYPDATNIGGLPASVENKLTLSYNDTEEGGNYGNNRTDIRVYQENNVKNCADSQIASQTIENNLKSINDTITQGSDYGNNKTNPYIHQDEKSSEQNSTDLQELLFQDSNNTEHMSNGYHGEQARRDYSSKYVGCVCAWFDTGCPSEDDIPLMSETLHNVTCHRPDSGEDVCEMACESYASGFSTIRKGAICSLLGRAASLKLHLHTKTTEESCEWKYTGCSSPPVCCSEYTQIDC